MIYYNESSYGTNYSVDELQGVRADLSVIPSYTLSFSEASLYVAEAIEESYNDLFTWIGVNELAVFESTGSQIVYEGGKLSEIKEAIIKWLKGIWEKIKGFFNKILDKFEEMRKKSVEKYKKITNADIDKIDDSKSLGTVHAFDNIEKDEYIKRAKDFLTDVKGKFNELGGKNVEELDDDALKSAKDDYVKKTPKEVSGLNADVSSIQDMKEKLRRKYLGDEKQVNKAYAKEKLADMQAIVFEGSTKRKIKADYNGFKDFINREIKDAKKIDDAKLRGSYKYAIIVMKEILDCAHAVCGVVMDACVRRSKAYKTILAQIYKYAKVGEKGSTNESYYGGYRRSYQTDLISEAFDW